MSHKSGLDLKLLNLLRGCFANGLGPDPFSKMLGEFQNRHYHGSLIKYLDRYKFLHSRGAILPSLEEFGSPKDHDVAVPSASYLSNCYCNFVELKRSHFDKEIMKLSGDVLKADHSFKVPKHIMKISEQPIFEALYTVTNEYGEIRSQILTYDKSHAQIRGPLEQLRDGLLQFGHTLPRSFYVDDSAQSKAFLEGIFPSLRENIFSPVSNNYPLASLPPHIRVKILERNDFRSVLFQFLDDAQEDGPITIGLDCEWNINKSAEEKVALLQIAWKDHVYLIRVYLNNYLKFSYANSNPKN